MPGDRAAVAEAAEVLGRIETPCREVAQRADALAAALRAVRLGRILDQEPAAPPADLAHAVGVERPAVEVDTDDADGLRGGAALELRRVEVVGRGVDVAEDRHATGQHHRLGGGKEAERRHQHFGAGSEPQGAQGDHQRVGAVGDTDHGARTEEAGEGTLELLDLRALNVRIAVEDLVPALAERGFDALAGTRQVENRDRRHGDSVGRGSAAAAATAASGWRVHGVS